MLDNETFNFLASRREGKGGGGWTSGVGACLWGLPSIHTYIQTGIDGLIGPRLETLGAPKERNIDE